MTVLAAAIGSLHGTEVRGSEGVVLLRTKDDECVGEAGELDDPAKQWSQPPKFHDRDPLGDSQQHRKAGTVHELEFAKIENDPIGIV